jgi:hypothetical protein
LFYRKGNILLILIVWFWVWGICPWDASGEAAHAGQAAHAAHGHHEADDTHHASKGAEHSCAGAGIYNSNQNLLKIGWLQIDAAPPHNLSFEIDLPDPPFRTDGRLFSLLERAVLPKLRTEYYRLYSVYRI